jgi:muconolactone delta-isomerase
MMTDIGTHPQKAGLRSWFFGPTDYWRSTAAANDPTAVGLYDADSRAELDGLLRALPLASWMQVTVVPLASHPNDPGRDVR